MEILFLNSKIEGFINSLEEKSQARVRDMIILLSTHTHNLRMPFSKSLGNGLFELRIVGMTHIRVMYTFRYDQIWILHAFIKKTNKIQQKEIEYSMRYLNISQYTILFTNSADSPEFKVILEIQKNDFKYRQNVFFV